MFKRVCLCVRVGIDAHEVTRLTVCVGAGSHGNSCVFLLVED